MHTKFSDGGGTFEEVGKISNDLGFHFVITGDHNTTKPYIENLPEYVGETLMVPGLEISTDKKKGHFLVIGDGEPLVPTDEISSDLVFEDAVEKDMMIFIAHPFHPREKLNWEDWDAGEFTGMELFNLDESWRGSINLTWLNRLLSAGVVRFFSDYPVNHLAKYPDKPMKKFDQLCQDRKIVGIGSTDAHSKIRLGDGYGLRFPDYTCLFNFVQTVIITRDPFNGEFEHDRQLLFNALRNGNAYVGFGGLENPRGFEFSATSDTDETAIMGEDLNFVKVAKLFVFVPDSEDVLVQIIKDGELFREYSNQKNFEISISESGVYRVQVFQHRKMLPFFNKRRYPWILSNPIYISSSQM